MGGLSCPALDTGEAGAPFTSHDLLPFFPFFCREEVAVLGSGSSVRSAISLGGGLKIASSRVFRTSFAR